MRRRAYFAAAWLTISAPAAAQVAEVGVGISRACVGSEGSVCGDDIGPMWSTHASLCLDDRLEIGLRLAALSLSDITVYTTSPAKSYPQPRCPSRPGIDSVDCSRACRRGRRR